MNRPSIIHLLGNLSGLAESFARKSLVDGMTISVEQHEYARLKKIMSEELQYLGGSITTPPLENISSRDAVMLFNNNSEIIDTELPATASTLQIYVVIDAKTAPLRLPQYADNQCVVAIHDMIPSTRTSTIGNDLLSSMVEALDSNQNYNLNNSSDDCYWWVSEGDVATGIYRLVLSAPKGANKLNICGRRAWTEKATFDQLSMLYNRTIAGTTGAFEVNDLTHSPIVPDGIQSIEKKPNYQRPDLSTIHDLLVKSGGEGWRPIIPLRTSLMLYLATKIK